MAKNEAATIARTVASAVGFADEFFLFDTGSDDDTAAVVARTCAANDLPLRVVNSKFVNYAASYNEMLDYADAVYGDDEWYALIDANDEIVGTRPLDLDPTFDAYKVERRWIFPDGRESTFFFEKLVKSRRPLVRYVGAVHAYVSGSAKTGVATSFRIAQRRGGADDDGGKYERKLRKDVDILKASSNERDVFYLALSERALGDAAAAISHFERRFEMRKGFWEERWHSCLRLAEMTAPLHLKMLWACRAVELYAERAEPFYVIARSLAKDAPTSASCFADVACAIPYPSPEGGSLFVDAFCYDVGRFALASKLKSL